MAKNIRQMVEDQRFIQSALGFSATNWDGLGVYGLAGHDISRAHYTQGGSGSLPNPRGKVKVQKTAHYKRPRIVDGVVVLSRVTSEKTVRTGVYFADDCYERPVRASHPDESIERTVEERFNGQRVMVHGTIGEAKHNSGGRTAKRARHGRKVEIIR